ncbi:MAG TPA: LuxR C-terminal-related transcriptional regulator [Pirellulaceae bacterium]|jgi:FixJ family two-component response regulator
MDAAITSTGGQAGTAPPCTVFVVDNDVRVRRAVDLLILSAGFTAESFSSLNNLLADHNRAKPGCLVIEFGLPNSGLEILDLLVERGVFLPVILLTQSVDVSLVTTAIRKGAFDVIIKPFPTELLGRRIREAVERDVANRQKRSQNVETQRRIERLTDRERDVMRLLASGDSAKQIGHKLSISSKTVDNHRAKVLEKMGVDNPTQLALQLTLLD